jgi:preprotein translocase subunit SecG
MSLVIAPLTTTALSSVSGSHSGLASGVNNAISRTATLLAIALLGIFVFTAFSASLDARTSSLDLAPEERAALEEEKSNLGAAEAPSGVDAATGDRIESEIRASFVTGFRVAMGIAALLALVSALCATLILEPRERRSLRRGAATAENG